MNADFIVLDTDVASLSFKRQLPLALLAQIVGKEVCITFVTLGELTKWAEMRRWGRHNRDALERWLDRALLLPYDRRVATSLGRTAGGWCSTGPATAGERLVGGCVLPGRGFAASDPERQGLRGLRRTRRPSAGD